MAPGNPARPAGASDSGTSYSPGALGAFSWNGAVGITPALDAIANGTCAAPCLDGHVDPRQIIDVAIMNGNIPAPFGAFDEDDEMFLTLSNTGMIMRPALFEQHTIHFHAYPNAPSVHHAAPHASA